MGGELHVRNVPREPYLHLAHQAFWALLPSGLDGWMPLPQAQTAWRRLVSTDVCLLQLAPLLLDVIEVSGCQAQG